MKLSSRYVLLCSAAFSIAVSGQAMAQTAPVEAKTPQATPAADQAPPAPADAGANLGLDGSAKIKEGDGHDGHG
jgi:hypothetical protein